MQRPLILAATAMLAILACTAPANAQRVFSGAYENPAGGVTAGGAHDVIGPRGRSVGEGGVVTNGSGGGIAGSRGCSRGYYAAGCRSGASAWDNDGNFAHESSAVVEGRYGGYGSANGSLERDSNGDWNGSRSGEYTVGDRTYSADTTFESGEGIDRSVSCSGSGCR